MHLTALKVRLPYDGVFMPQRFIVIALVSLFAFATGCKKDEAAPQPSEQTKALAANEANEQPAEPAADVNANEEGSNNGSAVNQDLPANDQAPAEAQAPANAEAQPE
jgi:hypothetical protein